jgi:hypothetical protein
LESCSSIFGALLNREIAVRGAVAHGSYVTEKTESGTFVAGRAIIDAYQFEGQQDWIGIMLAPSVVRKMPDIAERCHWIDPSDDIRWREFHSRLPWIACVEPHTIPFHGDDFGYQGYAVVPNNGAIDPASMRDSLRQTVAKLRRLKSLAPNPATQRKHERAIAWLSHVQSLWHRAAFRIEQSGGGPES